jgi:hypothetical protein
MVFAELNTIPTKRTQRSRKIPLYKKAKWENIKDKLKMIKEEIEKMYQKGNKSFPFPDKTFYIPCDPWVTIFYLNCFLWYVFIYTVF